MHNYIFVFLGAGIGGVARYAVNSAAAVLLGAGFPFATLFVNVVGSFLMGAIVAWFGLNTAMSHGLRLFLATGLLGGFTTFSAFSLDAIALWEQGHRLAAAAYVASSIGLALLGLAAGAHLVRSLN